MAIPIYPFVNGPPKFDASDLPRSGHRHVVDFDAVSDCLRYVDLVVMARALHDPTDAVPVVPVRIHHLCAGLTAAIAG